MADIKVVLTIDNQKYIADMKRAEAATKSFGDTAKQSMEGANNSIGRTGNSTGILAGGVGKLNSVLAGVAFIGFARSALEMADAIDDLSKSSGIAISTIMAFRTAVKGAGGDYESAGKGIGYYYTQLDAARQGNLKLQNSFGDLQISLEDLTKSDKTVFMLTLERLAKLGPSAEKTALQGDLLGKAFRGVTIDGDFISKLKEGEVSSAKYAESVKNAADLNDTLNEAIGKLKIAFVNAFGPIITGLNSFLELLNKSETAVTVLGVAMLAIPGVLLGRGIAIGAAQAARALIGLSGAGKTAASTMKFLGGKKIPDVGSLAGLGGAVALGAGAIAGRSAPKSAEETAKATEKAAAAVKAEAEAHNRVEDALKSKILQIQNTSTAYLQANAVATASIRLEGDMIGKSKDRADVMKAQADIETKGQAEILKLRQARATLSPEDAKSGRLQAAYDAEIAKIKQAMSADQARVAQAILLRNEQEKADKLRLFSLSSQVELNKKLVDIQGQISTTLLPELEKRYYNLEAAARASGEAAIVAEEQRRNTTIARDSVEAQKYYDIANKGLTDLRNKTSELLAVEMKLDVINFRRRRTVDVQNDLLKIQDEMVKSTLPELAKKYYELEAAARDAAKAQIDAQEMKLGRKLDPNEQKAYYDASSIGVERLKKATKESYDASRTFGTGWKSAFNSYVADATNAAKAAENIFNRAMGGIEDALVSFVKTGKFEWKSFVADMTEQLLRSQIKSTLAGLMTSLGVGNLFGGGAGTGQPLGETANNAMWVRSADATGAGIAGIMDGRGFGGGASAGGGGGGFGGLLSGIGSLFGGGRDNSAAAQEDADMGAAMRAMSSASSASSGGGGFFSGISDTLSSIGSGISDMFGGFFANGGQIGAGKFGMVGERGPELIGGPASITPLGGSVTYNINAVDAQSFRQMIAQDPSFLHAVVQQGAKSMPGR